VIVAKIQSSKTDFDTSVDELINLAKSDVPEEVITAMTKAVERPESSVSQRSGAYSGSVTLGSLPMAQPMAPNQFTGPECSEPGIFLLTEDGISKELEPSMYMGSKSSGLWKSAMTYGIASQKSKAMLQGLKANTRIPDRSPTFYFCFEEEESGLSYETFGATTPSQFLLVKLDVKPNQDARLLVTGKFSTMTGGYSGPPAKYRENFTYEKIAGGVYKILTANLPPGEYAFFYTGSASSGMGMASAYGLVMAGGGGGKVFDFSIE